MDNKKWLRFPQTSPSEHSSTLREPLTDFLHQHLTDVKNKGTLSDQMSPSLSTEPNCSPGLCSGRIRFLTSCPPALPKAETILKSNPYFHQNQCSSSLSMGMVAIFLLLHLRLDILSLTDALYLSNLFTQPVHTKSFP